MIINVNGGGGGGASLNFKIVCNPKPSNPAENTIWVDTDAITGYYFAVEQPENMQTGEVWINTGTLGNISFNVLKKNSIMILPGSVKQMMDGLLVNRAAEIWKNDQWIQFSFEHLYLFKKGDGVANDYEVKAIYGAPGGLLVEKDKITMANAAGLVNPIWIEPKIDLKSYKRLLVEVECIGKYDNASAVTIGVGSDIPSSATNFGELDASVKPTYTTSREIYEVPISNVPYERYVKIWAYGVAGYIHNIWLE